MRFLFALVIAVTGGSALAQGYAQRDGDAVFEPQTLKDRLSGEVLRFYDDGQSQYYEDGRYTYTYANDGGTAYGYWRITEAGEVCINYVNGFARCDLFVMNDGRLILLDDKGARFPVRPK